MTSGWGTFKYYYELDFSSIEKEGQYVIALKDGTTSTKFGIGEEVYKNYQEDLLIFMRQQRCGYNPFLDLVCHQEYCYQCVQPRNQ